MKKFIILLFLLITPALSYAGVSIFPDTADVQVDVYTNSDTTYLQISGNALQGFWLTVPNHINMHSLTIDNQNESPDIESFDSYNRILWSGYFDQALVKVELLNSVDIQNSNFVVDNYFGFLLDITPPAAISNLSAGN